MSTLLDDETKRWTARCKSALVLELISGKTTVAEANRSYDLPSSGIEKWVEDGKHGMENALRANPQDLLEQYEKQLKELSGGLRRSDVGASRARGVGAPTERRREVLETIRQELQQDGLAMPVSKLCR